MRFACCESLGLLRLIGLAALLAYGAPLHAEEQCSPANSLGVVTCVAGLAHESVVEIATAQEGRFWCWAASISMIFAHYGYKLPQTQVVASAPKISAEFPAASGEVISGLLSKAWVAQDGKQFESVAITADRNAKRYQLTNKEVIAELSRGRPLLVGTQSHAMVLVALHFQRSARGTLRIDGGTVIDPTPGVGIRSLTAAEMRPTYLAAVRIRKEAPPVQTSSGT